MQNRISFFGDSLGMDDPLDEIDSDTKRGKAVKSSYYFEILDFHKDDLE